MDEIEKVQRQRIAGLIGHVLHLTYAAMFDKLIQEEKLKHCNGCAIDHPSQRQHLCLMMDNEDAWTYYRDDVVENIDLKSARKTSGSVCTALGFKLGGSWDAYMSELPKLPWTSMYLTSLELDGFGGDLQSHIIRAIYEGPNGIKGKDFGDIECPERIVRKEETLMDMDSVITGIQKLYLTK